MKIWTVLSVLGLSAGLACSSHVVTISNTSPRYTTDGQIMPAHDGNILLIGNQYYFYGMSYGSCVEPTGDGCSHQGGDPNCGFNTNHTVLLYTSPDLSNGSWKFVADVFPDNGQRPSAIYYRPKIRYNPTTKEYVFWINAVPAGDFSHSFYVSGSSPSPTGPFVVKNTNVPVFQAGPGDFDIFADNNGTAYIIYTSINNNHQMSIERLTPDWLNTTRVNSGFFGEVFVEAPAMFRRGNVYYALFGHCCCFCAAGSGVGVYTATSVFGPYTPRGNIGCTSHASMVCPNSDSVSQAQQNCVFQVPDGQGNTQYMWVGDRWQSAPDRIKDHDFHVLLSAVVALSSGSHVVTINNASPRYTTDGQIMPAHDGNIILVNGTYYYYGMSYGACLESEGGGCSHRGGGKNCGFNTNHTVLLYTSPDLSNGSWQFVANVFPDTPARPRAIYYRPKIRYNPATRRYVFWINGVPDGNFAAAFYVSASSPNPEGPFTIASTHVPVYNSAPGDFDIFMDDDGAGYLIYTSFFTNHHMSIERLTQDWLNTTRNNSGFIGEVFVEAPALFKRRGIYYALFDHCCCFCADGSGAGVYTATSIFGPYTPRGNIECTNTSSMLCPLPDSVAKAQQNCVFQVPDGQGDTQFIWTGDRWQSAPDHSKDHDFQYWAPLVFNDSEAQPNILPFRHFVNEFNITVG